MFPVASLEEFLRGTMHSVNIISAGGRTLFAGASQYLVRSATTTSGLVNADMNLPDGDPRVAPMVTFAERVLHALERLDGACHLELFHTPDGELVFLEVGARFKGLAGLAAMQRHYGLALANTVFAIESSITNRPYDADRMPCLDAAFLLRRGVAACLVTPDVESRFEMRWKVRPGQRVDTTGELGGTFLLWNESEEALHRDFIRLADYRRSSTPNGSNLPGGSPDTHSSRFPPPDTGRVTAAHARLLHLLGELLDQDLGNLALSSESGGWHRLAFHPAPGLPSLFREAAGPGQKQFREWSRHW